MSEPQAPRPRIRPIEPLVTYQPEWSPWFRQFMTVALIIAVVFGLVLLIPVLQILVTTFLLAFLMYVPARYIAAETFLNFRGGVAVCYLILLLSILLFFVLLVPNVVNLLRSLPEGLVDLQERAANLLKNVPPNSLIVPIINLDLEFMLAPLRQLLTPDVISSLDTVVTPEHAEQAAAAASAVDPMASLLPSINFGQIVNVLTSVVTGVFSTVTGLLTTSLLAIFLSLLILLDLPNYQSQIFSAIPPAYHREVRILMTRIGRVWRGFFRVQVTIGVIIGIFTALQLTLMGAGEPIGVAVIVAIISLIPSIGGFFALIPLAIVPLISGSTVFPDMSNVTFALLVVGVNLVWTQIIWNVVAPKLMGDAISLPLPLIIVGIGIGAALGGILGAFLIVPIAGSIRVLLLYILAKINARDPFPGEGMPELVDLDAL
jgi:predicted PurR-regulated permease PerM